MKRTLLSILLGLSSYPLLVNAATMTTSQAIEQLNLTELAQTYSQDKITLATGSDKASAFDALLIDMDVISAEDLKNESLLSQKLSTFVSDQTDLTEKYLGNVSDKNIVERVQKAWQDSTALDDEKTLSILNSYIDKDLTTGYNVIDTRNDSHFNPELMIRYGHSDIQHASQLLYLMKSENFDPKVQFVPKSSAFLYLPEWGEPSYPVITLDSGKMVAVVKEYNLDFEFQSVERKTEFMSLINQYAKKDSADEKGLIVESWWQPFYRSYTELKGYEVLSENRVKLGQYQVDLMGLPENAQKQKEGIKQISPSLEVETIKTWVNPSFYRYMQGDFK